MINPGSSQQLLIYMSIDPQGMAQWKKSHGAHAGLTQHSAVILRLFGSIFQAFSIKIMKYEDGLLILDQNDIFFGHNVVDLWIWFLQLRAWIFNCLAVSHTTEVGSSLTDPGHPSDSDDGWKNKVIEFIDFSSHPGTRTPLWPTSL